MAQGDVRWCHRGSCLDVLFLAICAVSPMPKEAIIDFDFHLRYERPCSPHSNFRADGWEVGRGGPITGGLRLPLLQATFYSSQCTIHNKGIDTSCIIC